MSQFGVWMTANFSTHAYLKLYVPIKAFSCLEEWEVWAGDRRLKYEQFKEYIGEYNEVRMV